MIDKIKPLDRETWQGYEFPFDYTSHNYYDIEINRTDDNFNVSFIKKPFDKPYTNPLNDIDKLFKPWLDDVKAWGIEENGRLVAAIETSVEVGKLITIYSKITQKQLTANILEI